MNTPAVKIISEREVLHPVNSGDTSPRIGRVMVTENAAFIVEAVNSHDRLTAEVGRLRDVLHSIHLRAELAEADGVHMRSALGNIKDDAAKALNPEEPK